MQGQLRQQPLTFAIETACAQSGQPLHIEIDSELNYRVLEKDASPLVFLPTINFSELEDPSIIDAF